MTARVSAAVAVFVCVFAGAWSASGQRNTPARVTRTAHETGPSALTNVAIVGQAFKQRYDTDRLLSAGGSTGSAPNPTDALMACRQLIADARWLPGTNPPANHNGIAASGSGSAPKHPAWPAWM